MVRVWAVPRFFQTFTCSSLPVVASIFTAELCPLSRISVHDSNNFIIYSDSRNALQALGILYTRNPLVLKIRFLCDLHPRRKFLVSFWTPSHVGLSSNEEADVLAKRAIHSPQANHNALPLQDYVPSVPLSSPVGLWSSCSQRCRCLEVSLSRLRIGHTCLTHLSFDGS